jgi:hypothetical protein
MSNSVTMNHLNVIIHAILTPLSVTHILALNAWTVLNNLVGSMWKEAVAYFEVLLQCLPRGTEENY